MDKDPEASILNGHGEPAQPPPEQDNIVPIAGRPKPTEQKIQIGVQHNLIILSVPTPMVAMDRGMALGLCMALISHAQGLKDHPPAVPAPQPEPPDAPKAG